MCLVLVLQESHEFGYLTIVHASWSQASQFGPRSAGLSDTITVGIVPWLFCRLRTSDNMVVCHNTTASLRHFTVLLSLSVTPHAMTPVSIIAYYTMEHR